jgi:spore coat polysaccharide biosynthesis protein SpsF|tara:strand:+ start:313 stop:999 length:687 start_codon:yes stop_codon:yes gene_type:complete
MYLNFSQKISVVIQARLGSTRLPSKVLKKIDRKNPLLYYVISQLQHSQYVNDIIVATTTLEQDDELVEYLKKLNIKYFRGDPYDVLDRYYNCAKKFSLEKIIRITADNPLIDPTIVDKMISVFNSNHYDFVTNCFPRTYPYGTEVEIFTFSILEKIWKISKNSSEREHVTLHFYNNSKNFKIYNVTNNKNLSHLKWTVDTESDFQFVSNLIKKINKRPILTSDIIKIL